ncbi:hypothetical protein CPC197_0029B, partial [Chlamydia psittaci C1/97]
PLPAFRNRRF